MYKVEGTHITMTRGDTLITRVEIKTPEGETYTPDEGDSIRFALKSARMTTGNKQFRDREPLVIKNVPTDSMLLIVEPEDTKSLDFGEYKYDIELTQANGKVDTFIFNADLTIAPEVH